MRTIIRDLFGSLDPWGKFWLNIGLGTLGAAVAMSFDFGWSVSIKHALFLACLSIITAFAPMAAEMMWGQGRKGVSVAIAMICVPCLLIEFYSHAGYTAGLRGSNIGEAGVQNAKYDGRRKEVAEAENGLAFAESQLAALMKDNPWVASVSPDALRASLASANLAIELEAKRGGCRGECLKRTKERDAIAAKVALAEEKNKVVGQIDAWKRVIADARAKADGTERKFSAVDEQNRAAVKWVALAVNRTTEASELQTEATQQMANLAMAIAGTGLPAFALFIAGLFRRKDDEVIRLDPARTGMAPAAPRETPAPAAEQIVITPPRNIGTAVLKRIAAA